MMDERDSPNNIDNHFSVKVMKKSVFNQFNLNKARTHLSKMKEMTDKDELWAEMKAHELKRSCDLDMTQLPDII